MENYQLLNKIGIFNKLKKVQPTVDFCYPCSDLIDVVSDKPIMDKRLINDFTSDELVIKQVSRYSCKLDKFVIRNIRHFTNKGLEKYIHNGHIFAYVNVCEYFHLTPINKLHQLYTAQIEKMVISNTRLYNCKLLVSWILQKRTSCKLEFPTNSDKLLNIVNYVNSSYLNLSDESIEKIEFLQSYANL